MIQFDKSVCSNLTFALQREWLETNGLGGYAASSLVGLNTRRYHGLLVAALHPPVDRFVLLSKFEETLILDGARIELSCNQYTAAIHPQGYQFLSRFEKEWFPVFVYQVGPWQIRKTVFMLHGRNATCVQYAFDGPADTSALFEVRPLLAYRDYHSLTHENNSIYRDVVVQEHCATFSPYLGLPPLLVYHNADSFLRDGYWYKSFEYMCEQERGLDFTGDLFSPGYFRAEIKTGASLSFLAAIEKLVDVTADIQPSFFDSLRDQEQSRRENLLRGTHHPDAATVGLRLAADQFLVRRGENMRSVIAGYPWFTDWGRDSMISLPGLLLATGNYAAVRDILDRKSVV